MPLPVLGNFLSDKSVSPPQGEATMADFFLKPEPGEDAWALEDHQGMIVFYFKTATAITERVMIHLPSHLAPSGS